MKRAGRILEKHEGGRVLKHTTAILTAAASLTMAALLVQTAAALTTAEIVSKAKPAVVTIKTINTATGDYGFGTGWFCGPHTVMTNVHVLEGAYDKITVTSIYDHTEYGVEYVNYINRDADLATFIVAEESPVYLQSAKRPPMQGDQVVIIGDPQGYEGTVSTGTVAAFDRDIGTHHHSMQLSAPVSPGSSGSPVLNSDGDVCGMIWGVDPRPDARQIAWAVDDSTIVWDIVNSGAVSKDLGGPLALATKPIVAATPTPTPPASVDGPPVAAPKNDSPTAPKTGKLLRSPLPPYPKWALKQHITGNITISITVADGSIVSAEPVSGPPGLASHSARWVKAFWKFSPGTNGTFTLPVQFTMH